MMNVKVLLSTWYFYYVNICVTAGARGLSRGSLIKLPDSADNVAP